VQADGCNSSALFRAFNRHVLHRLQVTQHAPLKDKLRVTLLSRSTEYRRILNLDDVRFDNVRATPPDNGGHRSGRRRVRAARRRLHAVGRARLFAQTQHSGTPFLSQLEIDASTDIFMSMHGSGLTHLLFLPDWAGGRSPIESARCSLVRRLRDLQL